MSSKNQVALAQQETLPSSEEWDCNEIIDNIWIYLYTFIFSLEYGLIAHPIFFMIVSACVWFLLLFEKYIVDN